MSNFLAIAAVTAALRNLLDAGLNRDLPGTRVTTRPLDKARDNSGNQVNLFLYQMLPNPAWRNTDLRGPSAGAGSGSSPLALNLHYVISAYGRNEDEAEPVSHRLLGRVMQILHDHPVLSVSEIRNSLPGSDLDQQGQHVRISLQPIALEEMSRLWNIFQSPYRTSVVYEVSVVLLTDPSCP
jgi:hypothetical protein